MDLVDDPFYAQNAEGEFKEFFDEALEYSQSEYNCDLTTFVKMLSFGDNDPSKEWREAAEDGIDPVEFIDGLWWDNELYRRRRGYIAIL